MPASLTRSAGKVVSGPSMLDRSNIENIRDWHREGPHGIAKKRNEAADRALWKGQSNEIDHDDLSMGRADPETDGGIEFSDNGDCA